MKSTTYIFLFILIVSSGCQEKVTVALDNSREIGVEVGVDGESVYIPQHQMVWVELGVGNHELVVSDSAGNQLLTREFDVSGEGLVATNPSGYVLVKKAFSGADLAKAEDSEQLEEKELEIGGQKYTGPYTYFSEDNIFIKKTWDYYPIENFPVRMVVENMDTLMVKSKLYRESDFIGEYDQSLRDLVNEMTEISADMRAVLDSLGMDVDIAEVIRYLKLESAKSNEK